MAGTGLGDPPPLIREARAVRNRPLLLFGGLPQLARGPVWQTGRYRFEPGILHHLCPVGRSALSRRSFKPEVLGSSPGRGTKSLLSIIGITPPWYGGNTDSSSVGGSEGQLRTDFLDMKMTGWPKRF